MHAQEKPRMMHLRTAGLGKGFAFVARQKRLTLDADHFYADLIFYYVILNVMLLSISKPKIESC